jgi:hypothetical protein
MSTDNTPRPRGFATLQEALAEIRRHETAKQCAAYVAIRWSARCPTLEMLGAAVIIGNSIRLASEVESGDALG